MIIPTLVKRYSKKPFEIFLATFEKVVKFKTVIVGQFNSTVPSFIYEIVTVFECFLSGQGFAIMVVPSLHYCCNLSKSDIE